MRDQFRNITAVILTTIYCLAIAVVMNSYAGSGFYADEPGTQEKVISEFSVQLIGLNPRTESSVNASSNIPQANVKEYYTDDWNAIKATERLFIAEFTQYICFTGNIPVNYRKTDLLFPFQYFW